MSATGSLVLFQVIKPDKRNRNPFKHKGSPSFIAPVKFNTINSVKDVNTVRLTSKLKDFAGQNKLIGRYVDGCQTEFGDSRQQLYSIVFERVYPKVNITG